MKIALDTTHIRQHTGRGIGVYAQNLATYLSHVGKTIKLTNTNPDLIHFPNFELFFLNLPLKKTCPWVVTIHDVIPLVFPDKFNPGIRGKIKFLIKHLNLHRAEAIITD